MNKHDHNMFTGDMARTYNARTGGCNVVLANHLISLIKPSLPPPTSPLRILDNACGPAVLTTACLANPAITDHKNIHLSAVDISEDFITANAALIASTPLWTTNGTTVDTAVMNGMELDFPDNTFDVSFTSLAIFAFPNPVKGASELYRTLKSGGVAAVTTWKRVGWMPLLHEAEAIIRPGAEPTKTPIMELCQQGPGELEQMLKDGGFRNVVESDVLAHAWWYDEKEAAKRMSESLKMMLGDGWTDEEKEKLEGGFLNALSGGSKHVVHGEGGKVGIEMVAWTGVGRK